LVGGGEKGAKDGGDKEGREEKEGGWGGGGGCDPKRLADKEWWASKFKLKREGLIRKKRRSVPNERNVNDKTEQSTAWRTERLQCLRIPLIKITSSGDQNPKTQRVGRGRIFPAARRGGAEGGAFEAGRVKRGERNKYPALSSAKARKKGWGARRGTSARRENHVRI